MAQNETGRRWPKSARNPKLIALLVVGFFLAAVYYGALLWLLVWLFRDLGGWLLAR